MDQRHPRARATALSHIAAAWAHARNAVDLLTDPTECAELQVIADRLAAHFDRHRPLVDTAAEVDGGAS
jgi:hypothetical protein